MAVLPGPLAHRPNPVFPPQTEAQELLHIVTIAGRQERVPPVEGQIISPEPWPGGGNGTASQR